MPLPPDWNSPYLGIPESQRVRMNVGIAPDDKDLINSVVPMHGFLSLAIQTFVHDIAQHITQNKLTYGDREQVINYVRQRADSCFAAPSSSRDERDGIERIRQNVKNRKNKRANV